MSGRFSEGVALLRKQVKAAADLASRPTAQPGEKRSWAVTLAMLADLYADNNAPREACPLYAQADEVFTALDANGQLSELDRTNAFRMIHLRQEKLCK